MGSLVFFGVMCACGVVIAIPTAICDKMIKIEAERRRNRRNFLKSHPNYVEDSEGNLVRRP